MRKEKVCLFGASGTMGHEAFKELWKRGKAYDIVVLLRPSEKNKKLFREYEREAGIEPIPGKGVAEGSGFKIVWGDATDYADVREAVQGVDWVLDAMAFISPEADYYPEIAKAVNTDGIKNIVKAIEAQPNGAEHIKLIYTGTVAATGDRLQSIHWGRVGDPLKPSIFDFYAVTKVAGERAVLESNIKHWASLRMTYIMPMDYEDYVSLRDPIMFHQPIDSFMENITSRDAGYGLVRCLDIADDSDFWRRVYNMGGGPSMKCVAYDYMNKSFQLNGLPGVEACTERKWFALRNFHMQYYEDSHILNDYLHHWRDSLEVYWKELRKSMPSGMRQLAAQCRNDPALRKRVEQTAYDLLKDVVENHRNGTVYWYKNKCDMRITAFYKDYETFESIPDWGTDMPQMDPEPEWHRLDHGYDESKEMLDLKDLQGAAEFRGGECLSKAWEGDMYETLEWKCAFGHEFTGKPFAILKAGHWCPQCVPPPWNYDEEARRNPFFAQVWYPNHDRDENNFYAEDCVQDIAGADKDKKK
ncbi:MAG: NAD(P)-dependent oxidoreductase [Dehalococcoidia bacterium]|nr:MAG: NAD(P)-dependent oxidoreductase [Dehalococcoidia bacterium]